MTGQFFLASLILSEIISKGIIVIMTRKEVREMNGRERVIAAIRKEPLMEIPSSFSLHFPEGCENGEETFRIRADGRRYLPVLLQELQFLVLRPTRIWGKRRA